MRRIVKALVILILKSISPALYPSAYLRGYYFEESTLGWHWVWRSILWQKILGFNRHCPWPVTPFTTVGQAKNITFDINDLVNFQSKGCYYQCFDGRIVIGSGTYIAPNVGLITANHNPVAPSEHLPGKDIELGASCWIGMNSVILPGVRLGDHTVVGAGSVVTTSFPEGHCIIGGVPARKLKDLIIPAAKSPDTTEPALSR